MRELKPTRLRPEYAGVFILLSDKPWPPGTDIKFVLMKTPTGLSCIGFSTKQLALDYLIARKNPTWISLLPFCQAIADWPQESCTKWTMILFPSREALELHEQLYKTVQFPYSEYQIQFSEMVELA